MIHILTVHWKDDSWVDIQSEYLERNLASPYLSYAFLNYLPKDHSEKFFYSSTEGIQDHAVKLNLLADMASLNADSDNDILLFIDGDAFPVNEISEFLQQGLSDYPLVAIQRVENNGDMQPHPCFCATTVGFWKEIGGDWKEGYKWLNSKGDSVTDVGGNLLGKLEEASVSWLKILRSNKVNLHPLWFGLYGDMIYHHGAGFRSPVSRQDMGVIRRVAAKIIPEYLWEKLRSNEVIRKLRDRDPSLNKARLQSQEVLDDIIVNSKFFERFQ
jgi:hypothetical protein